MMRKVLVFDKQGKYLEDKIVEDDNYIALTNEIVTEIDSVYSFYSPKFVNGTVVEGLTKEEIDAIKATPQHKTEVELLIEENTILKEVQTQMSADFQALTDLLAQQGVI